MKFKIIFNTLLFISLVFNTSASVHLEPRMVTSPVATTFVIGSTGNTLIWRFEANEINDAPSKYTISINGTNLAGHTLANWEDNVNIVLNIDNLALGLHVVFITVNDTGTDAGQAPATENTVNVFVVNTSITNTATTSGTKTDISISTSLPILVYPIGAALLFFSLYKRKLNLF